MPLRIAARVLVLVCLAGLLAAPARAADNAAGFIGDLGRKTIDVLTSKLPDAERESRFRDIFDGGFDVPGISRFVLGPYWRTATEAQRQEFTKLFETYVVHAYAVRFGDYNEQQFKVNGERPEGDSSALVSSQIIRPGGGPPVKVDWRVARADGGYKITDVIVEGVSMAVTQRQEFASVIQRGGGQLDALLKLLREKIGHG